jgi:ionotropic glutamate receptor
MNFFKTSKMDTFQKMWNFMSGIHRSEVMVSSNTEALEKVIEADGKYAYMMESSSIQYIIERNCLLAQIGGNLDNKVRL